jgi:serine/threonine-protein kinase RsbW
LAPDHAAAVRLRLSSNLEAVALAGAAVRDFAGAAGLETSAIDDLELATVEAANNIVLHGYHGATDRRYALAINVARGEVRVVLSDSGEAIPPAVLAAPASAEWNLDDESGRGLAIIRACTDRMEYGRVRGRNRLLLAKRLPPARTSGR